MNGTDSTWHVEPEALERYRADQLDPASAFSVETHLVACVGCRAAASSLVSSQRLGAVWEEIVDRLDAPEPTPVERCLVRLGVRQEIARLLAGVPALTVPWLSGIALVLGFATLAAHARPAATSFFLVVAAIVPLLGVATAYGPGMDPMHEVGVAAPFRGGRLLFLRALAVLVVSTGLSGLAALALPTAGLALAWLVPSFALTLLGLAAGTFGAPTRSAILIAGGWVVLVLAVSVADRELGPLFGDTGQVVAAVVATTSATVLVARRERVERPGGANFTGWIA